MTTQVKWLAAKNRLIMKKRLLSGSFALFLIALLSLSRSQQQTKSRGARSLLSRLWKGGKWQSRSCKGPREEACRSAGFLSGSASRPSPLSLFCICLTPFVTSGHELPGRRVPASSTEAGPVLAAREQGRFPREQRRERHSWLYIHLPRVILWHTRISPERHTLSRWAAGLHIKPPASSASRGQWLSETALTEGRESLVILVTKTKTFLTFVFCALNNRSINPGLKLLSVYTTPV